MSIVEFKAKAKAKTGKPPAPRAERYENVTAEERAAAAELLRVAQALQRMLSAAWTTPYALAQAPRLIAEGQAALERLADLVGG